MIKYLSPAPTDVGPTTTATTLEKKHSRTNGEAQDKTDDDVRTDPAVSEPAETPETVGETNNGELTSGHLDGENNVRSETIFSSKKVTLPPRTVAEAETEETEVIPTYDLSTGENITNVIESEILENHQVILESNGDLSTQE